MTKQFTELSTSEQVNLAKDLINKINSEKVFLEETAFEFQDVWVDDIDNKLVIEASLANPIIVSRKASWQAGTEEGAEEGPSADADYDNSIFDDTTKCFKLLEASVAGYSITTEISDIYELEDVEVELTHISHEDSGIGHYEYWGFKGYDSHPYVEVEGVVTRKCDCNITFYIK